MLGLFMALFVAARQKHLLELIQQHKRDVEDIRAERDDAITSRDARTAFVAMAAHDHKNPLAAILGTCEMQALKLDEAGSFDGKDAIARYNTTIAENAALLLHKVDNLLAAASIEHARLPFQKTEVIVENIIADALRLNTTVARRKRIQLAARIYATARLMGAPARLFEAFDNLINNAIKYTPCGTTVIVSLEKTAYGRVRFRVSDVGPGIPEDELSRLFNSFERLSAQPTGGETSTGLGLSIVKAIVEAHEGRVWCESTLGEGADFNIELPNCFSCHHIESNVSVA